MDYPYVMVYFLFFIFIIIIVKHLSLREMIVQYPTVKIHDSSVHFCKVFLLFYYSHKIYICFY
jgi:hypothetical protein